MFSKILRCKVTKKMTQRGLSPSCHFSTKWHKGDSPLCVIFLIEPLDVAEILAVRQVRILGIHAVSDLERTRILVLD